MLDGLTNLVERGLVRPVIGAGLIIIDQTEGPEALRGRKVGAGLRARQSRIGGREKVATTALPVRECTFRPPSGTAGHVASVDELKSDKSVQAVD